MPAQNSVKLAGATFAVTEVLLDTNQLVDLDGQPDALVFDADGDTSMGGDTANQIDIKINNADDFTFSINAFTALSGSVIKTNTIDETTGAAGVTIDGALLKDGRSNLGRQVQALTVSGAITIKSGLVTLAHATVVIAATLAAPVAGDELIIVDASASGTAAHTVTCGAGVTFNGTNNTATLNAPDEALHIIALSATRWYVVQNNGTVAFTTV